MHVALLVLDGAGRGLAESWDLLWASLYGLTLGFLMSAVVQVLVPQRLLRRYAAGGLRGIAIAGGFGAISSSCSYGSAAATRSLYQRGADARAALSFLVSSTNMNVAIMVMFWTLVGRKFAFAELFGLAIAVATFVCSMGNVPVARFLKAAGVPLGANIAYIYGDLLILPLVRIYRRSFPPKLAAAFLALFTVGACLAGAAMEAVMHALP